MPTLTTNVLSKASRGFLATPKTNHRKVTNIPIGSGGGCLRLVSECLGSKLGSTKASDQALCKSRLALYDYFLQKSRI